MASEIKSFQENIRKSFIWYSLTPVIIIVITAVVIFISAWGISLRMSNINENEDIKNRIDSAMNNYYSMVDKVSDIVWREEAEKREDECLRRGCAGIFSFCF